MMAVLGFSLMTAQTIPQITNPGVTGGAVADQGIGHLMMNIFQAEAVAARAVSLGGKAIVAAETLSLKIPGRFMVARGHITAMAFRTIDDRRSTSRAAAAAGP